jgi:rhodanese-related sulfurtransferase
MSTKTATTTPASRRSEEECRRHVQFYQRRFPDVPTMTSYELQEQMERGDENTLLVVVDVRTKPERRVSMIPGAIDLAELQTMDFTDTTATTSITPTTTIVTYCTIGYRSGFEARRLREQYPHLDGHIYSLDGVLAYTHTGQSLEKRQEMDSTTTNQTTAAVTTATATTTNQVHTFGGMWNACAHPDYDTTLYGFPSIMGRLAQVGGLVVLRSSQHAVHSLSSCCCPRQDGKEH